MGAPALGVFGQPVLHGAVFGEALVWAKGWRLGVELESAFEQADVIQRQNIWPQEVEHEEHFGCPAANAGELGEFGDDRVIRHGGPAVGVHGAMVEPVGEAVHIADFLAGEADAAEGLWREGEQGCGGERGEGDEARPHGIRRQHADLLADDGAHEGGKGFPP